MDNDGRATAAGCPAGLRPASRPGLAGLLQLAAPGWRIDAVSALTGGTSARMWRVRLRDAHGARSIVVVRLPNERTLLANPDLMRAELDVLQTARAAGVPAPRVLAADLAGELLGEPALALEHLCGAPGIELSDPTDAARQLARCLASIHAVPVDAALRLRHLDWPTGPESAAAPAQSVLLHGDFWPGNTIWQDGRLVGVIDWEDAALGHPLIDVANARLELAWFWGVTAAAEFTAEYVACTRHDIADLPAWDIAVAHRKDPQISRWGLAPAQVAAMRAQLAAFVARARAVTSPAAVDRRLG